MKIYFERTGGFAGLIMAASIDLDNLSDEEADNIKKLVEDIDLFHWPEAENEEGFPDGFQYTITVEDENEVHTLQLSEGYIPEKLVPLVNNLSLRARYRREG